MEGFTEYRLGASATTSSVLQNGSGRNRRRDDDEYAWERAYERSWEALQEDEYGRLQTDAFIRHHKSSEDKSARRNRQNIAQLGGENVIRRGMIRYVVIVLDLSAAMAATDLKPSRLSASITLLKRFLREFADSNPLAQTCLVISRDATALRATRMSANTSRIVEFLDSLETSTTPEVRGEMTFQTSLEVALSILSLIPAYGNREVIVIHGALSTCDPGDILSTIKQLQKHKVRASVIGLGGEMHIAKRIAHDTGGLWGVAQDYEHLEQLLADHTKPPPKSESEASEMVRMVRMGFPRLIMDTEVLGGDGSIRSEGFECPRCSCIAPELPCSCPVCDLSLVSSAHLARSYHHLFPVTPFIEVPDDQRTVQTPSSYVNQPKKSSYTVSSTATFCAGCLKHLRAYDARYVSLETGQSFCSDCDLFIHESLHNVPGAC